MAKQKESPEATTTKKEAKPVVKKAAVASKEPKPDPKPTAPVIPFARWFASKKFKSHWKAGMEAYADTTGRKTVEEWDKLFKNY